MQAKRVRCVLHHEFSLIHLHSSLTTLPRPRLGLILSGLASASSILRRSRSLFRDNCLTHIIASRFRVASGIM